MSHKGGGVRSLNECFQSGDWLLLKPGDLVRTEALTTLVSPSTVFNMDDKTLQELANQTSKPLSCIHVFNTTLHSSCFNLSLAGRENTTARL